MDEERTSILTDLTETETAVLPEEPALPDTPGPETDTPAALPEPTDTPQPPDDRRSGDSLLRRGIRLVVYRLLPSAFLTAAVIVYTVLTVTSLAETELTVVQIVRTMLGEFTGGADNVRFTDITELPLPEENTVTLPPAAPDTASEPSRTLPDTAADEDAAAPEFPLYQLDMSSSVPDALGLVNETPYEADLNALCAPDTGRAIPPYEELAETYGADAPVVLILHTHATESYANTFADDFRSQDSEQNVTAVGRRIAERLTEHGIGVIHCTELFDYPDFNMAYYNAALAIRQYITDYPSISYVLDIHRDSILSGDRYVAPVTEIDGEPTAQIMFVVGTDHGGSGHTGWRDNLALAARLQKSLHSDYPSLMRDINLRSASFNEQYTAGSLLVEIGSCASTLEEVKNAAERFADHLIEEILG